jgi:oligoribonuclease NrnB/cAMP/cGMP phosphodiesterase (DHH superfamily)
MDLIIYHNSCADGFCAAYVAHQKWPEAELLPQDYGLEPPYAAVTGKDVIVVDFSWKTREENEKLAKLTKSFHIFDHHKSQKGVLAGLPFATFDLNRSGAGLAWDYLFGKNNDEAILTQICFGEKAKLALELVIRPRPWYVDYVEDRDLWRWKLPKSQAINAYLGVVQRDVHVWDFMVAGIESDEAAEYGAGALRQIEHYVREGSRHAQTGTLFFVDAEGFVKEYRVAIVNGLNTNFSELGGELADWSGIDVAIGWFERGDGVIQFGLRAHKGADASKLAQVKGGGGHVKAAGFELSIEEGRALIDAILGRTIGDSGKIFYEPMK